MPALDLMYASLLVINILKSAMALDHPWDPFGVVRNLTWIKVWLLFVLFFLFSFVSAEMSSISPCFIRVRVKTFSAVMIICLLASLLLPQHVFWYFYPIILLSSSKRICTIFKRIVWSLQAILISMIPGFTIHITSAAPTNTNDIEANIAEPNLEMNRNIRQLEGAEEDDGTQV